MAIDVDTVRFTSILFMILTTFVIAIYWFVNFVEADDEKPMKKRVNSFWTLLIHVPYAAAWFYFMFFLFRAPGIETAFLKATYRYDIANKTDGTYIYSETNGGKLISVLQKPEDYVYIIDEFDSAPKNGMIYTGFQKYKARIERKPVVQSPPPAPVVIEKEEEVHF